MSEENTVFQALSLGYGRKAGCTSWGAKGCCHRSPVLRASRLYLLELHEVCFQALGFLLVLLGRGKDFVSGGTGVFQLSLEVLHLSLREST